MKRPGSDRTWKRKSVRIGHFYTIGTLQWADQGNVWMTSHTLQNELKCFCDRGSAYLTRRTGTEHQMKWRLRYLPTYNKQSAYDIRGTYSSSGVARKYYWEFLLFIYFFLWPTSKSYWTHFTIHPSQGSHNHVATRATVQLRKDVYSFKKRVYNTLETTLVDDEKPDY